MTKTKEERIETVEAELAALKKELKADAEKPKVWRPQSDCGKYYYLGNAGTPSETSWAYWVVDKKRLTQGNVFKTKDLAERHAKKQRIQRKLYEIAGGYEFVIEGVNWGIYYNHRSKEWHKTTYAAATHFTNQYYPSMERAQQAIDELGDDMLEVMNHA